MVRQERAVRTRRALIRAAAEVFADEGYVPASLPVISERAGVSKGALYFHFESKTALAGAVEEEAARRLEQILEQARQRPALPRLQLLAEATGALAALMAADVVMRAGFQLDGDVTREGGLELSRRWRAWVAEMLRQAQHEGELASGVSWRAVETAVVTSTIGLQVLAARDEGWRSEERAGQLWGLLLRAAGRPVPEPAAGQAPAPQGLL
ncbi:ScbR family autoregulator-binding transcription factor [Streptomyces sp. NPDC021080]|uniref:ScbR family autoregulator-binding transcription factor n=1 Tax=Streptomyces sp. NPDC021080 TaxID=3365110 RepID=UPI0037AB47EE